ncbi:MAG: acyl carrier protein [Steroidobacteraceae bacterium]
MNTIEVLQDLLMKQYGLAREQVKPDAALAALGVDSLGLIELMFEVEDRFGITLPDDQAPALVTIADVVNYIDVLRKPAVTAPAG